MCSLFTLTVYNNYVRNVVFSPNGEYLASGYDNNTIGVWRVLSGERINTLTGYSD